MSTSATESNDESLDGILEEVDTLLAEISDSESSTVMAPSNSRSSIGWRSIDWDEVSSPVSEEPAFLSTDSFKVSFTNELHPSSKLPSPVEKIFVKNRLVYLKRDDLLRLENSGVSGNKARKFYSLNEISSEKFPSCIVSYGGPQSNAMVALAAIVHSKNNLKDGDSSKAMPQESFSDDDIVATLHTKRFVYYTKTLPRFLRKQPSGNLFRAQSLGMELVELTHDEYKTMFGSESGGRSEPPAALDPPVPGDSLWVRIMYDG